MAYLSYCVFLLVLLIVSICVWLTVANSLAHNTDKLNNMQIEGELVFVHVLYRHGDRNPVAAAPGSQYTDISYWPEGWGQLTTLGVQQEFALGQWLRRRYSNYLSSVYNVNDIYIQSSDVDRTLMSAQSTLAGLYPPFGNKIWNNKLLWQPIPVHTTPYTTDYLIAGYVPTCPSYQNALNEYMASDEMKQFENSIQPFYDYLTVNTETKVDNIYVLAVIRDSWFCESVHNYTLKIHYHPIESCGCIVRMTQPFSAFYIRWNIYVPYAAAITMELRNYQDEHYVQIFYKNSTRQNPEAIMIPGCGTACPLSKMYELYDYIIPKNDFHTECLIPEYRENDV